STAAQGRFVASTEHSGKYPGFLNHFSTFGVNEDKAEVFANLIVDSAYVERRATKDPVLRAKVQRMRELLAEFCPAVNDEFWEKARKLKRFDEEDENFSGEA